MIIFRAFRQRGVYLNAPAFRREIVNEFRSNIGPDLVAMHMETVADWKEQPEFEARLELTPAGIGVDIIPTGDPAKLWWWHSEGVEGRVIRPKRHRQPRQRQRAKGQRHGGRGRGRRPRAAALRFIGREGVSVYRRAVDWPGITARRHPERIAKRYRPEYLRRCENACKRGVRAMQRP